MELKRKRVVVTGMGVLSSIGKDRESFTQGLLACRGGIRRSENFTPFFENSYAAEIDGEIEFAELDDDEQSHLDRVALWAYKVGREAMIDADLWYEDKMLNDTGAMIGISAAGIEPLLPGCDNREISITALASGGVYGSVASHLTRLLKLGGGYEIVATACTASLNAIGLAYDAIQNAKTDRWLVLGSEPLYLPVFAGFKMLDAMAPGPCSPYSGKPGMSLGEGAAALVVEEYESAMQRGCKIYGEVLGYATSCDAYHETSPEPKGKGAVMVMRKALCNAAVDAKTIDYVNAHGTGTAANDRAETAAIKTVFEHYQTLPVSATKSYFGHNISAAGIMELAAAMLTLPNDKIVPTLNFTKPRDYVDLDIVKNQFVDRTVNVFIKNSYAFGGNNCSLVASMRAGSVAVSRYRPQRVVITGMGSLNCHGVGRESLSEALWSGNDRSTEYSLPVVGDDHPEFHWLSRSASIRRLLRDLPLDGEGCLRMRYHRIPSLNYRRYLRSVDTRKLHPLTINTLVALENALCDSGLKISKDSSHELGIVLGLSQGTQTALDNLMASLIPEPAGVRTSEFPKSLFNSVASQCALVKGIRGYNTTLASGYSASMGAVIQAYEVVRQQIQPHMLAGGADDLTSNFGVIMHAANKNSAMMLGGEQDSFRVYDQLAAGYHAGEAAALLVLESLPSAIGRNANISAEICGYGRSNAFEFPARSMAMAKAIHQAMAEAEIEAVQLDLLCGTSWGSQHADQCELNGLASALGQLSCRIPLTNFNGYFGFSESASALLNIQAALFCMERGEILPIKHTFQPKDKRFDYVLRDIRKKDVNRILVVGASDHGNCYALILRRFET